MQLKHSVVRRSLIIVPLFLLGHGFYYFLLMLGNRILQPEVFGLFYASMSLINVMLTPGIVLTMLFAQFFTKISTIGGLAAVRTELRRILRYVLGWGSFLTCVLICLLVAFGKLVGIESYAIVVLAPAVSFASFLFEIIRSAFQGLLRFAWFSGLWVFCSALQCLLTLVGLYYIGTVWAGLTGMLAATLIAAAVPLFKIGITRVSDSDRDHSAISNALETAIPFIIGYGLFTAVVNADSLLAYFLLSKEELGVYASSSILPKAVVTASYPIAQIVLPVIITQRATANDIRRTLLKGVAIALAIGVAGWLPLFFGADLVCHSRIGLRFCDSRLLQILALVAIPLGMLRILVVASLTVGRYRRTFVQLAALIVFVVIAVAYRSNIYALAEQFLAVCFGTIVVYAAITAALDGRRLLRTSS